MKVEKFYNKKERKEQFRARFQLNGKTFRPVADNRKKLNEMVDEIRAQEHRVKYELPVTKHFRTVEELFDEHLVRLKKKGDKKKISLFERVSNRLKKLLPPEIKINQLKKAHFQKYIDARLVDKNPQSENFILPETVNKELSAISVALKNAGRYFPELEDEAVIQVPKAEVKKERRRECLVEKTGELDVLLEYLRRRNRSRIFTAARRRLADELEIKYETGLRRAEVALLKKNQYYRDEAALRDVKRIKTGTVTKFFPLSRRAVEIIESRMNTDSPYIFSKDGKSSTADYKTLKYVCGKIGLPYGTFVEGGFVPHDLRHNFSTEIVRVTDIETAKELTGHTGQHIFTYLHTNEKQLRKAMNRREGRELKEELLELYNQIKNDNIDASAFVEKVGLLIKNG